MYICENVTFKVSFKFHWTPGLENQPQTFSELPVSWGRAKALGFGQSARHHGGCPRNTRPPRPRPRACSLVSSGCCYAPGWGLGTLGRDYDSSFPGQGALGDHATSWGAAVEGTQVPPLELRAPSSCLLTALLPPFIGTACMFSFLISLFHERQKKMLPSSSVWLGSKSAPGTKE